MKAPFKENNILSLDISKLSKNTNFDFWYVYIHKWYFLTFKNHL